MSPRLVSDPGDWAALLPAEALQPAFADGPQTFEVRATDPRREHRRQPRPRPALVDRTQAPPAPRSPAPTPRLTGEQRPRRRSRAPPRPSSTVKLYKAAGCTGRAGLAGAAASSPRPGLAASVPTIPTTSVRATATDAAGNASPCSPPTSTTSRTRRPPAEPLRSPPPIPPSPANVNAPADQGDRRGRLDRTALHDGRLHRLARRVEPRASSPPPASPSCRGQPTSTSPRYGADAVGNASTCSAERTYIEDSIRPQTTITSGPSGKTTNTPTFAFQSSESGSTFVCRFDSQPLDSCSGPGASHTPSGPPLGAHTFEVQATDQAGNTDPTPAKRKFTVTQ